MCLNTRWPRHGDEQVAVDELLDAAGRAFAELGVARATMVDVARAAGCSRATLYRYFPEPGRAAPGVRAPGHPADRRAAGRRPRRRRAGLAGRSDPRSGIAHVRADPLLAVWFEPENMAVPMAVSQSSELLQSMSVGLSTSSTEPPIERDELERRAGWLLRSIVSLLAMPGADAETERAMVESFVVPVLTAPPTSTRSQP